ncbi:MAG TPA: alpha/beta hydrolase [Solirubrobacteraceae bacterium]|nr:alpha/beta hydrolase [Solirubrobacteraceae bacterium]
MADERVESAIANWASRLISNGVDYNDFVRTTSSIDRWDEWLDAWTATADAHRELAEQALAEGHRRSAGEACLRAAISYHFSKFVWVIDPDRNRNATEAAARALYDAHELLGTGVERIEAEYDGGLAIGNLRLPEADAPVPLVVVIPGLDSTKEEFFAIESVFLDRGMATLSLDGPGQGEGGFYSPIRHDYEVAVTAALDALDGRAELDSRRVGAAGVSLGMYYAVRTAAFEPRVKAVAAVSGPYNMGAGWESKPSLTREAFACYSRSANDDEARDRAQRLNLEGVAETVQQPCLLVTGARDRVIPWQDTKRVADAIAHSEWVLYEDGTHVCNNIPFKYRPLIADWLRDRLG